MNHRYFGFAAMLGLVVLLSACGSEAVDEPASTVVIENGARSSASEIGASPAATLVGSPEAPAAAAIESGVNSCWSEDDRSTEGSTDVPNKQQWSSPPEMQIDPNATYVAVMNTSAGEFEIELLPVEAPNTVNNFVCLARAGYFDGTPFHRILASFVIQGGDPTGTGSGGPGYRFNDEPVNRDYVKGTLAMANAGPNTNGSQFFVVLDDLKGQLAKNYTIFGQVSSGLEVVEQLGQTPTTTNARGEKSVPTQPVTLEGVTIVETPGA